MNDEQVIRYLINKEVWETIYGKHVDKESIWDETYIEQIKENCIMWDKLGLAH